MLTANSTLQNGRYRIIRAIGQGGMGAVYEAYDNNLNSRVAIKEALVSDPGLLRAFELEGRRLHRLRHIALPRVTDYFTEAGGQYLVMDDRACIEGHDLSQMLKQHKRPFAVGQVLAWADTLLDALTYLHSEGVIHRDIKPANIKLTPKGQITLCVLDFGLAKGGLSRYTRTERSVYGFTPSYAPPEQIEGQGTDERSDLYALGATLYALLIGKAPNEAYLRQEYINDGYPDPLKPANQLNAQVPPHVAHALQQTMALQRDQRPASAAQMRSMLKAPPTQAVAPPVSTLYPSTGPQAPHEAQNRSYSQPMRPQTAPQTAPQRPPSPPVSPAKTASGANNQPMLFWAATIAVVLLLGVLVGAYIVGNLGGADDEPTTVIAEQATATEAPSQEVAPEATIDLQATIDAQVAADVKATADAQVAAATQTSPPSATPSPPAATPTLGPSATAIAPKDGMVQVYVPAGDFEMGSADDDPNAGNDEKPRHTVYLDAFWIDQTEVTNAMFAEFVAETGHQTDAEKEGSDNHPVVQVSWNDATAYCAWAERRLPTEAEWEKAAGGILTKEESRTYPWGNEAPSGERVNFCDQNCPFDHKDSNINDGYERTSPVGNYPAGASPYGALDMAGNVWEWVSDSWDENYYASSPRENPAGPSAYRTKVIRGGSWNNTAPVIRVRYRSVSDAYLRAEYIGFRCARSP